MYREAFKRQWENLTANFQVEFDKKPPQLITADDMNRWYRTNSFQWSSISAVEAQQLQQQKNKEFITALRKTIEHFSFQSAEFTVSVPIWGGIAAGICAGTAVGILLPVTMIFSVLSGIAGGAVVCCVCQIFVIRTARQKQKEEEKQFYANQLKQYENVLMQVFDQYHID